MDRPWMLFVAAGCALFFAGCASFDREWKSAAQGSASIAKRDPFGGAWDGQWTSEKHRLPSGPAGGRLRCIFTRLDAAHARAQFHANWLCFATGYAVTFDTERRGGVLVFRGEQNLGAIFGGVYRYDGRVTPQHFGASFASRFDHGRFEMHRPAAAEILPAGGRAAAREFSPRRD